jgi:opacity protein-like surface antigen
MRRVNAMSGLLITALLVSTAARGADDILIEGETEGWVVDASIYILGAGMDGTVGIGGNEADINVGFSDVLENLEMGGMGSLRVARGLWAFTTEVIYMGLGASKGPFNVDVDQWMVEPSASFRVSDRFETIVGVRYMNLSAEIRGPFGRNPSGTQDWWDPFVGARLTLPIGEHVDFNFRADIGGFDVGSELAWQAFPFFSWKLSPRSSLQAGYRWLDVDYDEGSDPGDFKYDVLTQGFQAGATFRF